MGYPILDHAESTDVFILLKRSIMSLLEDVETSLPFDLILSEKNKSRATPCRKKARKKKNIYPVLIVETLPKTFGKIDKINCKKRPEFNKEEEYLLTLIARIAVEIFIKEEL